MDEKNTISCIGQIVNIENQKGDITRLTVDIGAHWIEGQPIDSAVTIIFGITPEQFR